jgi:hypothetical protein
MHDAARGFLGEFGGLATDDWTPGPVMPQSPFRLAPCGLDPVVQELAELGNVFREMSAEVGAHLYPIGRVDRGESHLAMDPGGCVYVGRRSVQLLADTASGALEKLVMERRTDAPLPFVPAGDHLELPDDFGAALGADGAPRWSAETDWALRVSGWYPGRAVSTAQWEQDLQEADEGYVAHAAARRFLSEFGGLEIDQKGPGRTVARLPFRLDPTLAKWDYEIFEYLSEEVGTSLYPVGDVSWGNFYLGISEAGAVYMGMDSAELLGDTADAALDHLIQGIR